MAKKKVVRGKGDVEFDQDFSEDIEDEGGFESGETFVDSEGTPANKHAKELAKQKASDLKNVEPRLSFYTVKGGGRDLESGKVVKIIVKARGVYEVYVGNLKRNGEQLQGLVKIWQKEGAWAEPHQVKELVKELRAKLPKAKK